ncbi:DUF4136 domain-containing protein [Roseivirga sp. BDSF3-8]|uniref:DUF4136 domain-containing protein n=1 Tax=Roseivirga sp. BDSF3-8 TaxID=3241598 RepID=UPI0035325D6E
MKYTLSIIISFAFLYTAAACAPQVRTFKPNNKDLSQYQTFAYLPNSSNIAENRSYDNEEVNQTVIQTINTNMMEQGYTLDRDNPDLLVLISVKTDTETGVTREPYAAYPYTAGATTVNPYYRTYYYRGYGAYNNVIGYNTDTYQYQEGTLVIDIVERESKKTVWKGITSDDIYRNNTSEGIARLVEEVFSEYPLTQ